MKCDEPRMLILAFVIGALVTYFVMTSRQVENFQDAQPKPNWYVGYENSGRLLTHNGEVSEVEKIALPQKPSIAAPDLSPSEFEEDTPILHSNEMDMERADVNVDILTPYNSINLHALYEGYPLDGQNSRAPYSMLEEDEMNAEDDPYEEETQTQQERVSYAYKSDDMVRGVGMPNYPSRGVSTRAGGTAPPGMGGTAPPGMGGKAPSPPMIHSAMPGQNTQRPNISELPNIGLR